MLEGIQKNTNSLEPATREHKIHRSANKRIENNLRCPFGGVVGVEDT